MNWFAWMMAAFLVNGACTFGLRILTAWGWADRYTPAYLAAWYFAGAVFIAAAVLPRWTRPARSDLFVGAGLGICSAAGQNCLGLALAAGVPGNLAYPIALAGGLFIVVAVGVLVFREPLSWRAACGLLLGIGSVLMLALDGQ